VLFFDGVLGVAALGVWIFCIIDVITTPESDVRNLPKLAWLFIVILLVDIGSIAWLIAGRDWNRKIVPTTPSRPTAGPRRATNPDDDEEFLASLRARAEEQRRRAREAQRNDEPQGGPDPVG
jgi:hypothetical protein